jgi:hypothetical protein
VRVRDVRLLRGQVRSGQGRDLRVKRLRVKRLRVKPTVEKSIILGRMPRPVL